MEVMVVHNEFQAKALEEKANRLERSRQRAYDRKQAPAYNSNVVRLWSMSKRAADKGIDFDLTIEWLDEKMNLTHCEATGLEFKGSARDPFSLTIDRKDSSSGYTQENCWAVCWIYNRAKLDGTHEELMVMARALVDRESRLYDLR